MGGPLRGILAEKSRLGAFDTSHATERHGSPKTLTDRTPNTRMYVVYSSSSLLGLLACFVRVQDSVHTRR